MEEVRLVPVDHVHVYSNSRGRPSNNIAPAMGGFIRETVDAGARETGTSGGYDGWIHAFAAADTGSHATKRLRWYQELYEVGGISKQQWIRRKRS